MFRDMRKLDRQIDKDEADILLKTSAYGILSTVGESGFPYGVPVSYFYSNDSIYIRTTDGHKLDNIKDNAKVSFCIVGRANELSDEYSTYYESVIIYGHAKTIEGEEYEKAISLIKGKYKREGRDSKDREKDNIIVLKIEIEHETGKLRKGY